ncbi:CDP-glycerol glycerophosphotransferase family protein [Candidatus Woesearchaeota archaeon]|nr:CDP-glycerol glycerophosphotransferase family protein [Candidatus Woesearchaeota archaeon]
MITNINTLVFADDEEQGKKILQQYDRKGTIIITTGIVTKKYIKRDDVKHYSDFVEKYKNPNYFPTIYWLQEWAEKKVIKNKNIKEVLEYDGFSLWYFIEYFLFYEILGKSFEEEHPSVAMVTYTISIIEAIFQRYQPQTIVLQNNNSLFCKLLRDYCKQKINLHIIDANISSKKKKMQDLIRNNHSLIRSYLLYRIMARKFLQKLLPSSPRPAQVIILSNERFCKEKIQENIHFGGIIEALEHENISYKVVEYDQLYSPRSLMRLLRHIRTNNSVFIGNYYTKESNLEFHNILRLLEQKWQELAENKDFAQSFSYKGIDMYPYLNKRFIFIFTIFRYYIADVISLSRQILLKEKPGIVLIEHDENYFGKGILVNNKHRLIDQKENNKITKKKDNTTVISLQTELLYPDGCVSRHIRSEEALQKDLVTWRPIADVKCVSGSYGKEVLCTHGNYPKEIITVTGHPGYDIIINKIKKTKTYTKEKFGISSHEKLVVFASGGVLQDSEIIPALVDAIDALPQTKLIIKCHPSADLNLLRTIVNTKNSKNVFVMMDVNLYELLAVCDLFVSVCSTVVIEAMLLDKPVMLINVVTCPMPYVTLGGAYAVSTLEEIKEGIQYGLTDKKLHLSLKEGRKKFLEEYLYKIDGKSSKRVVAIIKQIMRGDNEKGDNANA